MNNTPKAWYVKNSDVTDEPRGLIHAATHDGKFTLCEKKLNGGWWFETDEYEFYEIDCPKCLEMMRKKIRSNNG